MVRTATIPKARSRKSPGGPAALQGFLYQLIASADWATTVAVREPKGQVSLAGLLLEPPTGGDSLHRIGERQRTIQVKNTTRPLALTAIVDKVFPDLFGAVDPTLQLQDLVLQSNLAHGRLGPLPRLQALLREETLEGALKRAVAEDLRFRLRAKKACDARAFFDRAGAAASRKKIGDFQVDAVARERFAILLRRFQIDPPRTPEEMRAETIARLREVITHPAGAAKVFKQLIGDLFERASLGDHAVSVENLLEALGIPTAALGGLTAWSKALAAGLDAQLDKAGYRTDEDVREGPSPRIEDKPVVFTGPSGVGKTWMLARAALAAQRRGDRVVWLEGLHGASDVRARVTDRLQAARGHAEDKINPEALADFLAKLTPGETTNRVLVCLDRFATFDQANEILADSWWAEQGLDVMAAFPACDPGIVALPHAHCVAVPNFTAFEVRALFRHRKQAWASLPSDVRTWLERPLLARLYGELAEQDDLFRPQTEYELVGRAWNLAPRRVAHPGEWNMAKARLRAMLDPIIDDLIAGAPAAYPWSLAATPWSTPERNLLEEQGLLRWAGPDALQLDHDRFLAWGVAEAIAERRSKGLLNDHQLTQILRTCLSSPWESGVLPGRAMGYVAMDVFWFLAPDNSEPEDGLVKIMLEITGHNERLTAWDMWKTLGLKGFRLMLKALEGPLPSSVWSPDLARALGEAAPEVLGPHDRARINALLRNCDDDKSWAASLVVSRRPDIDYLPTVLERAGTLFTFEDNDDSRAYINWTRARRANCEALEAIARQVPDLFIAAMDAVVEPRQAAAAAHAAAVLAPRQARPAWERLRDRIGEAHRLDLDRIYLGLVPSIEGQAAVMADAKRGHSSFSRLAEIRPDVAAALFETLDGEARVHATRRLGDLRRHGQAAQALVVAAARDGTVDPEALAHNAASWSAHLGQDLSNTLMDGIQDPETASRRLQLLAGSSSPATLKALEARAGESFGQALTTLALARLQESEPGKASASLEALLLRQGPEGFGKLTAAQLLSSDVRNVHAGLRNALVGDETLFLDALIAHAEQAAEPEGDGFIPLDPFEALAATAAQAAVDLARRVLGRGGTQASYVAAQVALLTDHADLADEALDALQGEAKTDLLYRSRLLATFDRPAALQAETARQLLDLEDSHARAQAAWVAQDLGDEALAVAVQARLTARLANSADHYDGQAITALLDTPVGPQIMRLFEDSPANSLLRRVLAEHNAPQLRDHPTFRDEAMHAAFGLDDTYHRTPRDGLYRLWSIDEDVAFEAFDEGLRRGGKVMEGAASGAIKIRPDRALAIILERLPGVSDTKIRDDIGRALRGHGDLAAVSDRLQSRMKQGDEQVVATAAELAGWIARPELVAALETLLSRTSQPAVLEATRTALTRSDRMGFLETLNRRLACDPAPLERRRLMAISLSADPDRVVSRRRDPLSLEPYLLTVRDEILVHKRLKK